MASKKGGLGPNTLQAEAERAVTSIIPSTQRKQSTPRTPSTRRVHSTHRVQPAEVGCKPGFTRKTFHVNKEQLEKIEAFAYWERQGVKDVIETAFDQFLKGKKIKPKPTR